MVTPFVFNFRIMDYYPQFAYLSIVGISLLISTIFISAISYFFSKHRENNQHILIFGIIWYFIALLPVILFSQHKFPYYLPIALSGFLLSFINLLSNLRGRLIENRKYFFHSFILILLIAWVGTSLVTEEYFYSDHWAPRRALIAKKIIDNAQIKGNGLFVLNTDENRLALNGQDAAKVIFGNETITKYSTASGVIK
jgi:multisubunit Na+/H+ antiporter MnhF subunit